MRSFEKYYILTRSQFSFRDKRNAIDAVTNKIEDIRERTTYHLISCQVTLLDSLKSSGKCRVTTNARTLEKA